MNTLYKMGFLKYYLKIFFEKKSIFYFQNAENQEKFFRI